jgi:hypothetical protein
LPEYTYHNDDTLDLSGEGFITALLPVIGALGLFSQHHGRAMGEEVYWCETCTMISNVIFCSTFLSPFGAFLYAFAVYNFDTDAKAGV